MWALISFILASPAWRTRVVPAVAVSLNDDTSFLLFSSDTCMWVSFRLGVGLFWDDVGLFSNDVGLFSNDTCMGARHARIRLPLHSYGICVSSSCVHLLCACVSSSCVHLPLLAHQDESCHSHMSLTHFTDTCDWHMWLTLVSDTCDWCGRCDGWSFKWIGTGIACVTCHRHIMCHMSHAIRIYTWWHFLRRLCWSWGACGCHQLYIRLPMTCVRKLHRCMHATAVHRCMHAAAELLLHDVGLFLICIYTHILTKRGLCLNCG